MVTTPPAAYLPAGRWQFRGLFGGAAASIAGAIASNWWPPAVAVQVAGGAAMAAVLVYRLVWPWLKPGRPRAGTADATAGLLIVAAAMSGALVGKEADPYLAAMFAGGAVLIAASAVSTWRRDRARHRELAAYIAGLEAKLQAWTAQVAALEAEQQQPDQQRDS